MKVPIVPTCLGGKVPVVTEDYRDPILQNDPPKYIFLTKAPQQVENFQLIPDLDKEHIMLETSRRTS